MEKITKPQTNSKLENTNKIQEQIAQNLNKEIKICQFCKNSWYKKN